MAEWRTMTLREAGVQLIDCVHQTPAAVEIGYPYITIPQMKNGRVDFSSARRITAADFVEWTKKARPRVHDVVLSRRTNPGVTATFGEQWSEPCAA
jgi:type I restriction enzyme S subunit